MNINPACSSDPNVFEVSHTMYRLISKVVHRMFASCVRQGKGEGAVGVAAQPGGN